MSSRARLDSTVLASVDVGDQPVCSYVFIVEGLLGPRQAFSIDSWTVGKEHVTGWRNGIEIIAVPVNAPWAIVRRELLIFTTVTAAANKRKVDDLAVANFEKELFPTPSENAVVGTPNVGYTPGPGLYA